ncbi:MAG TPA: hypothetical protein VG755_16265 [Nannocystaceae bacterium]|nr:hypothetical protein [Nannocystaceae bacterium]
MTTGSSRGRPRGIAGRIARLRRDTLGDDLPDAIVHEPRPRAERPHPTGPLPALPPMPSPSRAGWDHTARPSEPVAETAPATPIRLQILSVLSDPRVDHVTVESCMRLVGRPRQDVETTLDAMTQAGELVEIGGASKQFRLPVAEKERLENMFRSAAIELGEQSVLAEVTADDAIAYADDDGDEPRLPVTAGLLSLFLPGTGQLLNGDVGRASLVFAVWSLAWITHLSPVWTFVCLYAGAEAFFTAKLRGMERKLAKEALAGAPAPRGALPPRAT